MPTCLFCKREDLPSVPLTPFAARAAVAHVDSRGVPCLEGAAQETHSRMLGDDYPHEELLGADAWETLWDLFAVLPALAPPEVPVQIITAQPADPVEELNRRHAAELDGESVDLPDVPPTAPPKRPARRPRKRPDPT